MAAYVISEAGTRDNTLFDAYRKLSAASIEKYGGKYLVRSERVEAVEGTSAPKVVVVVEFPTMQRAREWYDSPEYAAAMKVRKQGAQNRRMVFVEGV